MTHQKEADERQEAQDDCAALLANCRTLQLATLSSGGDPESSYAPFVLVAGDFYCFLSELASHTGNLRSNPGASLMVIEDETESRNLFARKRLCLSVFGQEIDRESELGRAILEQFRQRFDETFAVLEALPDFHLFQFKPKGGSLIRGFGQAWHLDARLNLLNKRMGNRPDS